MHAGILIIPSNVDVLNRVILQKWQEAVGLRSVSLPEKVMRRQCRNTTLGVMIGQAIDRNKQEVVNLCYYRQRCNDGTHCNVLHDNNITDKGDVTATGI